MSDEFRQSVYVIKKGNAKGFKFCIEISHKNEMIEFHNCRYVAKTMEHANVIDDLIATKPNISSVIQKVDFEAGERVALAHMQKVRNSAAKGGMTTEVMRTMQNSAIEQENQQMADAIEKDSGLIITQTVDQGGPVVIPSDVLEVVESVSAIPNSGVKLNLNNK